MSRTATLWTVLLVILATQWWLHGSWIVDDAGITFSYARNVAEGHGWVSFPGEPAVEGFTNLLWLLLLIPFFWLDLFDPVWTPKLLGTLCAFGALLGVRRAVRLTHPDQVLWGDAGLCLLAATPAFAIWCLSGLENGLYALLTALLLALAAGASNRPASLGAAVAAGLVAAMAAATRPDGLVMAALWPAVVLVAAPVPLRRRFQLAAAASAATVVAVLLLTLWRWQTFGDVVPNTFHAKVGSSWQRLETAALLAAALTVAQCWRWRAQRPSSWMVGALHAAFVLAAVLVVRGPGVMRTIGGEFGVVLVAMLFGLGGRQRRESAAPWAIGTILAVFLYESLPPDWMGEHRFGTPFVVIALPWLAVELGTLRTTLAGSRRRWMDVGLLLLLLLIMGRAVNRSLAFRSAPTVPMSPIENRHTLIADWARQIGLETASVLVPDIGGALWVRRLRVMDLAGLCDAEVARLVEHPSRLADLILVERQPTFLAFHNHWATRSGLPNAPRFREDYLPIVEEPDEGASRIAGHPITSGVYIRREHAPSAQVLEAWRREWR